MEPEVNARTSVRYYNEINTRRRVSQLLCAPRIWNNLKDHRELLLRLIDVAPDDPLTRLWVAIDLHGFTDVGGVISSFQDDTWFASYLADMYDPSTASALSNLQETLTQFLDGVQTFLTRKQREVEREAQFELLGRTDKDGEIEKP